MSTASTPRSLEAAGATGCSRRLVSARRCPALLRYRLSQPVIEESGEPRAAGRIVDRAVGEMGDPRFGIGQQGAFMPTCRPPAHHRVGDVGMELQRQFAISAFDLLLGGGAGQAQHLVVVAFSVAGQNGLSSNPFSSFIVRLHRAQCLGLRATLTIEGRSRRSFNL